MGIRDLIGRMKSITEDRPQEKLELVPFEFSVEIADDDEQDLESVEDVFPSRIDLPKDPAKQTEGLKRWADGCTVLLSGVHMPVGLSYLDERGSVTKREVEVNKLFRGEDHQRYFSGFCHFRGSYRSFREDRMSKLIDLETGEPFPNPSVFFDKYGIFDSVNMEELQVMIHVLSYLARADRKFLDVEKALISDMISQYCRGAKKELVESYAFSHRVKEKDFLNEVSKLSYMDEYTVWNLMDCAKQLINADRRVTSKEQEFFDLLHSETHL